MKNRKLLSLFFLTFIISSLNAEVLVFSKAYQLALENAHSIKASVFKTEGAKERLTQEKARLYPQINLSAYYKKSQYNYNENYNATGDTIKQGLINYSLSVKQSIYNAEIYSKISLERSRSELYAVGVELEKEELAQSVFKVYLDLLKTRNKIELYNSHLKYTKSKLDELTKRYEMKLASKMDFLEMGVEYKSAKIDLKKEKKLLIVHQLKLKQLIGENEYELPTIKSDKQILESIESMRLSVLDKSDFSSNLQLLQAQLALKLSKKDIENSFDAHYPRLDLDISLSAYETDDPTSDSLYKDTQSIMLVLNVPVYSGGRVSSRVRELELNSNAASEELINTNKEIKVKYDEYMALFEASTESTSMYKDALESSVLYVDAIEQGYSHGLKSIIDLNDAKSKLYEVKYKYIENIYAMVDSYIGLLIVTNNFEHIELLDKLVE
ncbi:MAG: TolC family protein [Campylobacterota bacterium]|nr:TolC family protein [Campylobacterota bacterium]